MTAFLQDVRYGLRLLAKNPGFTAVAVLSLAVGIGANTAIFSVVNTVLLRPLPYRHPERLVVVRHANDTVAAANYLDWKSQNTVFEGMAAAEAWGASLTGREKPEQISALRMTVDFFPLLGVEPLLGRPFLPGDDQPGRERVVVLSHRLWQRRFGADRNIIGQNPHAEWGDREQNTAYCLLLLMRLMMLYCI